MCDFIPGQVMLCYPSEDPAGSRLVEKIKAGNIDHVHYIESVEDRITSAGARSPKEAEYALHLVGVPPGQEEWKATYLQFYYKISMVEFFGSPGADMLGWIDRFATKSYYQFVAAPNHVISITGIGARIGHFFGRSARSSGTVDASTFALSADHGNYKTLLGITGPSPSGKSVRVGILDTGIGNKFGGTIAGQHDFTGSSTPSGPGLAADENGHGTMVAKLIDDVSPGCKFMILKVADSSGTIAEWDILAALCMDHQCEVLNLSVAFGLQDVSCPNCGRQSHGSRSAVFENILDSVAQRGHAPVIIASAGNQSLPELEYPARFGNVLAVGSVDSSKSLSSFSNVGNTTHDGQVHTRHCVAPGGQTAGAETVGSSPHEKYFGTSFAAAYATALVAREISNGTGTGSVISKLQGRADITLPSYNTKSHGFGLLKA